MRVLGVDPGLTRCGIGAIEGTGSAPRLVAAEVVRTAGDAPLEQRLLELHAAVRDAIDQHGPDVVACERVLFSRNVRTAMATGQAAGVALLAAATAGCPVVSYAPTAVKLAVAGHGSADKSAVARMVALQLGLAQPPEPVDVTDALAVALTHLLRARSPVAAAGGADEASGGAGWGARGWAAVLDRPHVRVAGGTSSPRPPR